MSAAHLAAWGAWLAAPFTLRALALLDTGVRPEAADALGFAADAGVAALGVALGVMLARISRLVATLAALACVLAHYASYETAVALGALPRLDDAGYLVDPTFLGGSALALRHPLLLAILLASVGGLAWTSLARCGVRAAGAAGTLGLLLLGGLALASPEARVPAWRQRNVVQANSLEPFRSEERSEPGALEALLPELRGDLAGEPRFELGHERRNVLLVVLEGVSGVDLETAAAAHRRRSAHPLRRLDRLFRENLGYASFIAHNRRTNRGLYGLLCGEMPGLGTGLAKMTVAASGPWQRCLPERLRARGYRTVYLQAAPLAFMQKDLFLPRAGFERVMGTEAFAPDVPRTLWGVDDGALFARAEELVAELAAGRAPWFVTLLTVGTHHPYVVPADVRRGGPRESARAAFAYLDRAVGDFVAALEAAGVRDDTLVLLTSDEAAGLWPGTDDAVAAALTQSWSFLAALLPERRRELVREPYAQSDLALSVLDYLGLADAAEGLHGRSLFRRYAEARHFFFGNVNLRTLGAVAPDGYLLHCQQEGELCAGYDAFSGALFADGLAAISPRPELESLARSVAAASRSPRASADLELPLGERQRLRVESQEWRMLHGFPVALAAGEWLEVALRVRAEGEGAVELEHGLRFPRQREALQSVTRIETGQTLLLHYAFDAGVEVPNLVVHSAVRRLAGRGLELVLEEQQLRVRRTGASPARGLTLLAAATEPPEAAPELRVMSAEEIERVARSMTAEAAHGADGPPDT